MDYEAQYQYDLEQWRRMNEAQNQTLKEISEENHREWYIGGDAWNYDQIAEELNCRMTQIGYVGSARVAAGIITMIRDAPDFFRRAFPPDANAVGRTELTLPNYYPRSLDVFPPPGGSCKHWRLA